MLWLCVISISLWRAHLRSKANQLCLIIPVWICFCDSVHSMLILTNDWYLDNSVPSGNISMSYTAVWKWHKWLWCLRFNQAALSNHKANNLSVCNPHISTAVHLIYFKLVRCVAQDPRKSGVEFGATQYILNKQPTPLLCAAAGAQYKI